jgi:hypothetical protein
MGKWRDLTLFAAFIVLNEGFFANKLAYLGVTVGNKKTIFVYQYAFYPYFLRLKTPQEPIFLAEISLINPHCRRFLAAPGPSTQRAASAARRCFSASPCKEEGSGADRLPVLQQRGLMGLPNCGRSRRSRRLR